mmetsp:Transcript_2586/g.3771  ORF Transcript_2586/g.3771 Transcript_2586/m.3771 type:complete len:81 (-) Transcript_2586:687-929(-)
MAICKTSTSPTNRAAISCTNTGATIKNGIEIKDERGRGNLFVQRRSSSGGGGEGGNPPPTSFEERVGNHPPPIITQYHNR